jgi:hypothetical protein
MSRTAIPTGQAWPAIPPELASEAPGLPRVFLVEAGEQPPRLDALAVDPLRPETWRSMIRPAIDKPPKAGAVVLAPPSEGLSPAPASPLNISSLAAHGLAMVGRLFLCLTIIVALGCKGCA